MCVSSIFSNLEQASEQAQHGCTLLLPHCLYPHAHGRAHEDEAKDVGGGVELAAQGPAGGGGQAAIGEAAGRKFNIINQNL